jgi:hypothetical protein
MGWCRSERAFISNVAGKITMHGNVGHAASARADFMSEKSDDSSESSDAMRIVQLAAEPRPVGDSVKAAIGRAARRLGWSYTRTRDVWYGDARRIDVREMDALREIERRRDEAATDAERRRQLEQLAVLRTRLQMRDPGFHREDIAALDWMLREIG